MTFARREGHLCFHSLRERRSVPIYRLKQNWPINGHATQQEIADYLFEPSPASVLEHLLPRIIESQIYQAILENDASEHSARMVAMKNATDNASDLVDDLTLEMNKARQAAITQELAEISGGAEAMK